MLVLGLEVGFGVWFRLGFVFSLELGFAVSMVRVQVLNIVVFFFWGGGASICFRVKVRFIASVRVLVMFWCSGLF